MLLRTPARDIGECRRGFTLIELMLAIAIVGVIAGIALPNIVDSVQRQRAIASEKEVSDFIVRARNFARTTGCETRVTVTNTATPHFIEFGTTETNTGLPCGTLNGLRWTANKAITLSVWTLADNTNTTPSGTLTFNSNGGTDETQEAKMQLSSTASFGRTIEVWPMIGSVNVVRR